MTQSQVMSGAYPIWTPEEDALLLQKLQGGPGKGEAFWIALAEHFPERSFYAVRQRWLTLRNKAKGIKPNRHPLKPRPFDREHARRMPEPRPVPKALPDYNDLTAAFFGDPRPGRSALDQRQQP